MNREAWRKTRLKYAAEVNLKVLPESTSPEMIFKYIDIGNVSQGALDADVASIRFADAPSRARRVAEPGDTVVSTVRTYLRAVAPVPELSDPLVFSTGFAVVHPGAIAFPRYLSWYLQGDEFISRVEAFSVGVSYPAVTATQLAALALSLPPLDEQLAIADYLDRETQRIDELIAEQRGLIEILRERRRAVLDFGFLRQASQIKSLRRLLEASITGPFGTQLRADEYVDDGVPVVNPTHIARSRIRPDMSVTVTPDKARDLERFRLHQGDVVLGRKGDVDKAAIVTLKEEGYICGSDSMALRPSSGIHGEYLWWYLQSPAAHRQLEEWSVGSTVAGLNQRTISRLEVPTVDLDQQVETSSYLVDQTTQIDALIAESEDLIALSQERRSALITAAVTGQIDVRTAV